MVDHVETTVQDTLHTSCGLFFLSYNLKHIPFPLIAPSSWLSFASALPIGWGRAQLIYRCVSPPIARLPSVSPQLSGSLCGTGYMSSKPKSTQQHKLHMSIMSVHMLWLLLGIVTLGCKHMVLTVCSSVVTFSNSSCIWVPISLLCSEHYRMLAKKIQRFCLNNNDLKEISYIYNTRI